MAGRRNDLPRDKAKNILKKCFPEAEFVVEDHGKLTKIILFIKPSPRNMYEVKETYRSAGWIKSDTCTFGHMKEALCIEAFRKFDIRF